ncbi:MAG: L-ribulose-5-phosphate 4-epimerase [Candidatus Atribacteria bacterium]|nr:L-ribulose-5-phosphate 4-epimerase [Candidatus Atribacteria bacterium]
MLEEIKEKVFEANLELQKKKVVLYTWGNASEIDREQGLVVIKPSGVPYEELSPQKMVVVDMTGQVVEGKLRPSVDTPIHLYLYRNFEQIGGVAHTHSSYASAWAQANLAIPCLGGTHSDYFYGDVPCTRRLTADEMDQLETNTGKVIVERFQDLDYNAIPAVLVAFHGPFTWGKDAYQAVFHSVVLEEVARIAYFTHGLNPGIERMPQSLLDRRYARKHGKGAYYGQQAP